MKWADQELGDAAMRIISAASDSGLRAQTAREALAEVEPQLLVEWLATLAYTALGVAGTSNGMDQDELLRLLAASLAG